MACDLCGEQIEDGELKSVGKVAIIQDGEEVNTVESETCEGCIRWVWRELLGKADDLVPVRVTAD